MQSFTIDVLYNSLENIENVSFSEGKLFIMILCSALKRVQARPVQDVFSVEIRNTPSQKKAHLGCSI